MDKETLYQEGLKIAQQKGYTGDFALYFAEGYVQGYEEGVIQVKKEVFAKMLGMGYDKQIISEITGLAIEEI